MQLQPTYFTWKDPAKSQDTKLGLIAQNVQAQFPDYVITDANGYLALDYAALVSPLIGAVKEQQGMIDTAGNNISLLQKSVNLTNGGTIDGSLQINQNLNVSGASSFTSLTVSGSAVFNGTLVASTLEVSGDLTVAGHLVTNGQAPTFAAMPSAGSNAVIAVDGNDTSGTITLTTGAATHTKDAQGRDVVTGSDPVAGDMATITFNKPFSKKPRIIITPNDGKSAPLLIYPSGQSATGFSFAFSNLPSAASGYSFSYIIVE